jgi:hypothetical protein
VSFFRFLLIPLVAHAGKRSPFVDDLSGICSAVAKDKERYEDGSEKLLEDHDALPFVSGGGDMHRATPEWQQPHLLGCARP